MHMLSSREAALPLATAGADVTALRSHPPGSPGREEVEEFVRRVYARRYGARIASFAPILVSLQDEAGTTIAAAGYRGAQGGPLFLERYLSQPIEAELATHAARAPSRREIVEIGHLTAERAGGGRQLMVLIGPHLAQQRFRWVVGTLTRELRHLLVRMGITPLALGAADPASLGEEAADWGSYYAHQPLVLAGELQPALRRLARRCAPAPGEGA